MYGRTFLSHPLIVDAVESLFVPLCIYNTARGGHDRDVLQKFKERAWNYPVVLIIDKNEKELIERIRNYRSALLILAGMVKALEDAKKDVPEWLQLMHDEMNLTSAKNTKNLQIATFAMNCFWSGEMKLGAIEGVIETRVGMLQQKEVVELEFDSSLVKYENLLKEAKKLKCANTVFARTDEQFNTAKKLMKNKAIRTDDEIKLSPQKDQKYQIGKTPMRFVPMTRMQATKVNAAIGDNKKVEKLLSSSQLKLLDIIKKNPKAEWKNWIGHDNFEQACSEVEKLIKNLPKNKE